jgi:hypothetical protein
MADRIVTAVVGSAGQGARTRDLGGIAITTEYTEAIWTRLGRPGPLVLPIRHQRESALDA